MGEQWDKALALNAIAQQNCIDPQRYLTGMLAKIGQTKLNEFDQFLPDVWKAEDAVERTAHL